MGKQRAFVRYTKKGKIVPGSLIETSGSYPSGPSLWYEVETNLCCLPTTTTTTTTTSTTTTTTSTTTTTTTTMAPEFVLFEVDAPASRTVQLDVAVNGLSDLNLTINWGDSIIENYTILSGNFQSISHTYSVGSYNASIFISDPELIDSSGTFYLSGTAITSVDISSAPNLPTLTINNTSITGINASINSKLSVLDLNDNPITTFSNIILPTSPITPVSVYLYRTQITTVTLANTDSSIKELYLGTNNTPGSVPLTSVVVNQPPNFTLLRINGANSLTTLIVDASSLENLQVYNCSNLPLSGLTLTDVSGASVLAFFNLPLITSFDLSNLPVSLFPQISNCNGLTTVDLSNCLSLEGFSVSDNTLLTTINLTGSTSLLKDVYVQNNAIPQATINNILIALDANGILNGTFLGAGGTNGVPSGAGITAKNNLIAKGWYIETN